MISILHHMRLSVPVAAIISACLSCLVTVTVTRVWMARHKPTKRQQNSTSNGQCKANELDPYSAEPRQGYLSWDDYFMSVAFLSAQRSKDPNKQVGACIVSQDQIILSIGYNGFPRGCPDMKLPWAKLSPSGNPLQTKYPYVCHAEMNAIMNKNTASLSGARLYVTMFPCNECAKLLIQAGIREVVFYEDKNTKEPTSPNLSPNKNKIKPQQAYIAAKRLLAMVGVKVRQHQMAAPITISQGSFI
ncbi:hypothetical protein ABBQ32_001371 [Trebouxia sp. C0010 RCD-2024]